MFDSHAHIGKIVDNAFVNSSFFQEWDKVADFKYHSYGILPPHLAKIDLFESYLTPHFPIGEIGIDKRYEDEEKQIETFIKMLRIAKKNDSLVTIHCVGWWGKLIDILRTNAPSRFIVHSFSSSTEVALELIRLGGTISLSPKAKRLKNFSSLITTLPHFLTESDMATGEEEEKTLKEWNKELSEMLDRDIEEESEKLFFSIF